MRVFVLLMLLTVLLSFAPLPGAAVPAQSPPVELPPEAQALLNKRLPGWRYVVVSDEERAWVRQYYGATARPDLIGGDFDDDGQADYAAFVEHGEIKAEAGALVGAERRVAVLLRRGAGYALHFIADPQGGYIAPVRKGARIYDYEAKREFTFPRDAVEAVIFEKAATAYLYENGRFRAIITGD